MNNRDSNQSTFDVSMSIREEIARFEGVHPCIYALYDLISCISDVELQSSLQENLVCIEDAFVNSQEWTLSRSVHTLRLGVVGSTDSGKSALVHRYMTGTYMPNEYPEGGRFKKELTHEGQSYLLLVRDEGGTLEAEFANWVDVVMLVFSLDSEDSFDAIFWQYLRLSRYREMFELPVMIVGTQDAITELSPRVINETQVKRISSELPHWSYLETCAVYGLNVERAFIDACHMFIQLQARQTVHILPAFVRQMSVPLGRAHNYQPPTSRAGMTYVNGDATSPSPVAGHDQPSPRIMNSRQRLMSDSSEKSSNKSTSESPTTQPKNNTHVDHQSRSASAARDVAHNTQASPGEIFRREDRQSARGVPDIVAKKSASLPEHASHNAIQNPAQINGSKNSLVPLLTPVLSRKQHKLAKNVQKSNSFSGLAAMNRTSMPPPQSPVSELPNPASTPILGRKKNFSKSFHDHIGTSADHSNSSPNATPNQTRKHYRLSNFFTKKVDDDKKSRNDDGRHGVGRSIPIRQGYLYKKSGKPLSKEWKKKYVTLLTDGRLVYFKSLNDYMDNSHGTEIVLLHTSVKMPGGRPRGSELSKPQNSASPAGPQSNSSASVGVVTVPGGSGSGLSHNTSFKSAETPQVKKKHRRTRSNAKNLDVNFNDADGDGYEFAIISLDNKQWWFEAATLEERDEWILAVEHRILSSIQRNDSGSKSKGSDETAGASIRAVSGNSVCADCSTRNPDWASINLGVLLCIECSGIHRNLGTHVSRVRSLDLDDWPPELVLVMKAIGNDIANAVWEANCDASLKPLPAAPREEKEQWIRAKYGARQFLPALPYRDIPLSQQLIDAVARQDVNKTVLVLSHCTDKTHVNQPFNSTDWRTALHITAFLGNIVILQLLLWCGADALMVDHEGHNAVYYAQMSQVPSAATCVQLLQVAMSSQDPLSGSRDVLIT